MAELYDFDATAINGKAIDLADYRGKIVLVVNVASKCGFTPQYEGLEALYREYKDQGLEILAFPCNQFGAQEPGDADEIANFCSTTYDVTFPVFTKIEVNGSNAHPVFKWMKGQKKGIAGTRDIKWNFTKFLLNREGEVVRRFGPQDAPAAIKKHLEKII